MQQAETSKGKGAAVATVLLAGVRGLGSGVLMALLAPSDMFSWAGLALLPLWFLLEVFFEVVAGFGASRGTRIASGVAAAAGLHVAWFVFRSP